MDPVSTPHLIAFSGEWPKTRIGILRLLWPTIQACLDSGHSLRDVHHILRLDGIEMAYSTLCWGVTELRRNGLPQPARVQPTAPTTAAKGVRETRGQPTQTDPLENLRRLTAHRPGFEYTGTLPDEKLFGLK